MRRSYFLTLILMFVPSVSPAIQLSWNSGASTFSFTEATRCTLVVSASPAEHVLPSEWRLLWVADSCSIQPLALNPLEACEGDIALVSEVDLPITLADSASNMSTAHFCSGGSGAASTALFLLDLPAGATGKLKVLAIDPSDPESLRVIQSSEVTFNGGTDAEFSPVVLRASISHPSLQLTVTAVGAGLEASAFASIVAADTSWRVPLDIAVAVQSAELSPGKSRWPIKTSVKSAASLSHPRSVSLTDVIALEDAAGVSKDDARYQSERIPDAWPRRSRRSRRS